MRSSERLSANIFSIILRPFLKKFIDGSPSVYLKKSLTLLHDDSISDLQKFVRSRQHSSGGFVDRAGNPDLYYTLFGFYLAKALGLYELLIASGNYAKNVCRNNTPDGVHLQCAAIIISELSEDKRPIKALRKEIRRNLAGRMNKQPEYSAFVTLLTCLHTGDYLAVLKVMRHLKQLEENDKLPSTVIAALVVINSSFNRPVENLIKKLLDYYDTNGGFKAVKAAPVTDMLSTAVSLYALRYAGYDLIKIKPECMGFIDSHFIDDGFFSNILDRDPDIEYTFYGLLALGSLAD